MNRVETDMSPRPYDPYDSLVDFELSSIMTRAFNQQNLLPFSSAISQLQLYQCEDHSAGHPLLKLENLASDSLETIDPNGDHLPATAQLQLSDFELGPAWTSAHTFPQPLHNHIGQTADCGGLPIMPYTPDSLSGPQSSYQYYKEGDGRSPWSSSPEFAHCRPLASVEEGEEAFDDKPYARLIYEALMLAPGHRMMLRDLYEWFRLNTTKPQESGSNGWQNSIRHNLSMNKAFENDRDNSRGSSRKANSVWVLTDDAIKNGIQSTTRYRKTGGAKRSLGSRTPAIQRQRSGAKGGRAARRAARQRHQERSMFSDPTPSGSPATTPFSDHSEYQSFDGHELRQAVRSWPMTPVEDPLPEDPMQPPSLSSNITLDLRPQPMSYGDENLHLESLLLQHTRDRRMNEHIRFHVE